MSERLFLPVGLTGSGKSTFVAALSYVVELGDVPGSLRLDALAGDEGYVHGLRRDWLSFPLERTSGPTELTQMRLKDTEGREMSLVLPDLPGEEYNSQWEQRGWSNRSDELAQEARGLLLFVHPLSAGTPDLINQVTAGLDEAEAHGEPDGVGEEVEAWSAEKSPAQTKLVDVLQFLRPRLPPPRPIRVSLVVSAWDRVERSYDGTGHPPCPTPKAYVWQADGFAQLAQYLWSAPEHFFVRTFGVSAQGGQLTRAEERDRLAQMPPEDRIRVVWEDDGGLQSGRDITEPIKWLAAP